MNRADSTEWPVKLSVFFFYSMDAFQHQLNDINRFIGVPMNKEFSCCFQSRRNVDFVKIFVIILPFFFLFSSAASLAMKIPKL